LTDEWKENLPDAQRGEPDQFGAVQYVDIHCHCLPGLDDGPATMADTLALCRLLVTDGMTTVIATPHQLGRYDGRNEARKVRQAVAGLNEVLKSKGIPLRVLPGADVRIDERIPRLLTADRILTLADGGRYVLLELPHEAFIEPLPLIAELAAAGVRTIISHPERYPFVVKNPKVISSWLRAGAYLQFTAGSFVGDFGQQAKSAAWSLIRNGLTSLVATDAHNANVRRPRMSLALAAIAKRFGAEFARRVCIDNPARILNGSDIMPSTGLVGQEVRK